jgi:hypothetical protein
MCFFLVIEKREGNLSLRVKLSIHLSSQNLIFCPLPSWNWPRFRKDSLTFNNPLQKCESPCFLCTCAMVLSLTYFLHKKSCQTPSSLINLNNHLPSRQRFWISMFRISNLPWSFGWQIILHFANLYFFLCSSLCELDCELDLLSCHCDLDCEFMSLSLLDWFRCRCEAVWPGKCIVNQFDLRNYPTSAFYLVCIPRSHHNHTKF